MSIETIQQKAQSTSTSDGAKSRISTDLDTFLKLLTTQLQNQDPLSPLKTAEFTNQLVGFANVEQSIAQSQHLETLIGLQKSNEVTGAVDYIGRTIEMEGDQFYMEKGAGSKFSYTLPKDANAAQLFIVDSKGKEVHSVNASKEKGEHIYLWPGTKADGTDYPAGAYGIKILAADADSKPILKIKYHTTGKVTGVEYGDDKTTLIMSGLPIDIGKVTAVVQDAKKATAVKNGAKATEKVTENSTNASNSSSDSTNSNASSTNSGNASSDSTNSSASSTNSGNATENPEN